MENKPDYSDANFLRIALNMCNVGVDKDISELIISLFDGIKEKKGTFSLMDASKIFADHQRKQSKSKLKSEQVSKTKQK